MTKKSTKKVKEALKKIPKIKAKPGFRDRLYERIRKEHDPDFMLDDRPEWDQVDFDGGDVKIASGDNWSLHATPTAWSIWLGILWIILSMPLWLGVWNSFTSDTDEIYLVPAPIESGEVIPDTFIPAVDDTISDAVFDDTISDAAVLEAAETIEEWFSELPFIWEDDALTFDEAFRLARMYLGPNDIFTWRGNDYTTMYIEEVVLFNN